MSYELMKKDVLKSKKPSENPTVRYVIGQTGSGKTTLISKIVKSSNEDFVIIDNDLWRAYYPNYDTLVKDYKTDEIPSIMKTMKEWRKRLIDETSDIGYNLVIHTSLTNPIETIDQINKLQKKGYSVSMDIIACNECYSRVRCCFRYIAGIIRKRLWKICNRS